MILLIECLIAIVMFSAIVVPMTAKDPIGVISDYPPAIRNWDLPKRQKSDMKLRILSAKD